MKRSMLMALIVPVLLLVGWVEGKANSISNIELSPPSPARLRFGEKVHISFGYQTSEPGGVRIFVRPFTEGALTPAYAASGSILYPSGSGRGKGSFTIRSGEATVDRLRFQMVNRDQSRHILTFYVPVQYHFSSTGEAAGAEGEPVAVKRHILPDGTVEFRRPDGSGLRIRPDGTRIIVAPDGSETMLKALQIEAPGPPPSGLFPNEEWLTQMNAWIDQMGQVLLDRIEFVVSDEASMGNYMTLEGEMASTLYERVDLRLKFLDKLLAQP